LYFLHAPQLKSHHLQQADEAKKQQMEQRHQQQTQQLQQKHDQTDPAVAPKTATVLSAASAPE
jgi:hypothetical protein